MASVLSARRHVQPTDQKVAQFFCALSAGQEKQVLAMLRACPGLATVTSPLDTRDTKPTALFFDCPCELLEMLFQYGADPLVYVQHAGQWHCALTVCWQSWFALSSQHTEQSWQNFWAAESRMQLLAAATLTAIKEQNPGWVLGVNPDSDAPPTTHRPLFLWICRALKELESVRQQRGRSYTMSQEQATSLAGGSGICVAFLQGPENKRSEAVQLLSQLHESFMLCPLPKGNAQCVHSHGYTRLQVPAELMPSMLVVLGEGGFAPLISPYGLVYGYNGNLGKDSVEAATDGVQAMSMICEGADVPPVPTPTPAPTPVLTSVSMPAIPAFNLQSDVGASGRS